jgi:hypothetical protein
MATITGGMRISPDLDTVDITRCVENITTVILKPLRVPLADAGPQQLSFSVSGRNPVELTGFKGATRIFRLTDATPNRIQTGANAALRFRSPPPAPPTGEIASFQVVEKARTISKPTRLYPGQPITLTNSTLIRAYHRNGAASSAVAQAQYINNIGEAVFCTADVKQCPDGSFVPRVQPSCQFAPCQESELLRLNKAVL